MNRFAVICFLGVAAAHAQSPLQPSTAPRKQPTPAQTPPAPAPAASTAANPTPIRPGLPPGISAAPTTLPAAPARKASSSTVAPNIGQLVQSAADSLVLVEGGQGNGSGFVCSLYGKRTLLTNQHVVEGNPHVRFTNLNQTQIKTATAKAATGHDIIAYEVPDFVPALEPILDFSQSVLVGDQVVVLGNTEGARVVKPLAGKVVGIGPNLVEISSEFLPGNSGSPIIHLKTGKVIGIATYALIRKVDSLTGEGKPSVRRFGYRLDTVQAWQPVDWRVYQAEAAAAKKITEFSMAMANLFLDMRSGRFDPSRHTDGRLKRALSELDGLNRNGTVQVDRARMFQNFLGELRNATQRDVQDLQPRLRYDYFKRELEEEAKFRTELHQGLGEAMRRIR